MAYFPGSSLINALIWLIIFIVIVVVLLHLLGHIWVVAPTALNEHSSMINYFIQSLVNK